VDVFETRSRNDAILLSSKATDKFKYDLIIAAGGDGTLHQVVNGVLTGRETEPRLPVIGIIPIGSGNDFAKTAGVTKTPQHLVTLIDRFQPKAIDVGRIGYTDFSGNQQERYFVNVADIGMGPEVVKRVLDSGRLLGSAVAYFKSIIGAFFDYRPMLVRASADDWEWSGRLRSLAVANGKFYGHGLCIAPDAKPDDNIFGVFICGNVSVFDFIRHSGPMKAGKYVRHPEVHYRQCFSVKFSAEGTCLIEGDGEVLGLLPASVQMMSRKLDFLI
jgi:YegS/Rv2252/BmrU family lipid kinase